MGGRDGRHHTLEPVGYTAHIAAMARAIDVRLKGYTVFTLMSMAVFLYPFYKTPSKHAEIAHGAANSFYERLRISTPSFWTSFDWPRELPLDLQLTTAVSVCFLGLGRLLAVFERVYRHKWFFPRGYDGGGWFDPAALVWVRKHMAGEPAERAARLLLKAGCREDGDSTKRSSGRSSRASSDGVVGAAAGPGSQRGEQFVHNPVSVIASGSNSSTTKVTDYTL